MKNTIFFLLLISYPLIGQKASWLYQIKGAKEIEIIEEGDGNQIFIKTFDLTGTAWTPSDISYHLLDTKAGKLVWRKSELATNDDAFKSKSTKSISAIQVTDSLLSQIKIHVPESFWQEYVKPRLIELDDRYIIYNQKALLIFDRDKKTLMFSRSFKNNDLYNIEYLYNKTLIHTNENQNITFNSTGYYRGVDPLVRQYTMRIEANDRKIKSSNTSSSEKALLIDENTTLTKAKIRVEKKIANQDFAISLLSASGGIISNVVVTKVLNGREWISNRQLNAAIEFYNNQFSFPYFVWFEYDNGWKINLLDCVKLKIASIKLGAANPNHLMYGCGMPVFKISGDGKSLFTFFFEEGSENMYKQTAISFVYKVDLNFLSLAKFDLNEVDFIDAQPSEITEASIDLKDKSIFDFILSNQPQLVLQAIKEGGNPNCKIKGVTPLMVATNMFQKETVNVLLDNAADATIADVHGWVPWHYAVVRSFNSSLVDKMLKAYKAKSDGKPWAK